MSLQTLSMSEGDNFGKETSLNLSLRWGKGDAIRNPCHFRFIGFDSIKFSTSISMIESRRFLLLFSWLSFLSFWCTQSTILLCNHDSLASQSPSYYVFHSDYEDILATSNLSLMTLTATDVLLALYLFSLYLLLFFLSLLHQSTRKWVFNQDESFHLWVPLERLDLTWAEK